MLAAGNVGVRELVNQNDRWMAGDDGIHIHLFKHGAFVFDAAARYGFQLGNEFFHTLSAVRFNEADDHIFDAVVASDSFAHHAVGFPHAWRIAEEKFEDTLRFFRGISLLQPIFRFFRHWASYTIQVLAAGLEYCSVFTASYLLPAWCCGAGYFRRHYVFLPRRAARQSNHRRAYFCGGDFSSFDILGLHGFRIYVPGRDAGIQL